MNILEMKTRFDLYGLNIGDRELTPEEKIHIAQIETKGQFEEFLEGYLLDVREKYTGCQGYCKDRNGIFQSLLCDKKNECKNFKKCNKI